jgi:hypothetical protein
MNFQNTQDFMYLMCIPPPPQIPIEQSNMHGRWWRIWVSETHWWWRAQGVGLRRNAVPRWSFNCGEEFTGVPCLRWRDFTAAATHAPRWSVEAPHESRSGGVETSPRQRRRTGVAALPGNSGEARGGARWWNRGGGATWSSWGGGGVDSFYAQGW